ncbi:MAG: hypothetical protein JSW27_13470 [Phycisphaerales bacterium]|nr:MAG: hypothetical protein JSW27_13470 [Phycisphaerales bacterium]
MKMGGTYRQSQHSPGHRLVGFGLTGFGWIIWALGKIFLTPRPVRIGLSGLLLWVGLPGVTLAQQASSQTQSSAQSSQGAIKDPFNPQGYMLEMAAKMREAKPSGAVFGETGIARWRRKSEKAVSLTPSSSNVTWLSDSNQKGQTKATAAPSDSSVKWLTPSGQIVRGPVPSEPTPERMGWRPSGEQTTSGPATQPNLGLTRWLTGAPETARKTPSEPVTGQRAGRPTLDQGRSGTLAPQPSIGHTKWLTPSARPTRQPTAAVPTAPAAPATPTTNQQTWSPPVYQGPPRSALPETPLTQMHWLTPAAKAPRPPMTATRINDQTREPLTQGATGSVQRRHSPVQARWLEPAAKAAPQASAPGAGQTAQRPTDSPAVQGSTPTEPSMDKETWLSRDNRAAQRALDTIRRRDSSIGEDQAAPAAKDAVASGPTYRFGDISQHTPESLDRLGSQPASQMLRLSGGAAVPSTAPLADDPTSYAATDLSQAKNFYERERRPWSLGADLDQYRAHAVREGTRDSGASLAKALERIGLAIEDSTNIITLGYASDRGEPFRGNDGKGLFEAPERVPMEVGATAASFGSGLYSFADLITFDGLPDVEASVYQDNHPIVRPMIFTGRTIGGVWKTTEEIGNAVTWGYFDNVTGSIGMVIEDLIEVLKHAGQAVTNLARVPVHLIAGEDREGADRALDWVLLVPLEFASNVLEMKGISNTGDYKTAFADKGVIGSMLEFGGSTFIVYRVVDELVDELKDDGNSRHTDSSGDSAVEPEPEPEVPVDTTTPPGTWTDFVFTEDGVWIGTRTP